MKLELNLGLVMVLKLKLGLLTLSLLFISLPASAQTTNTSAACPLDLGYVLRIPWPSSDCRNDNRTGCCQTLLSLYGVALSNHLKETSIFQLPDLQTSISCLSDFESKLDSLSLRPNLTSLCFDPLQFVITPNICAGIQSTRDWVARLGPTTVLDSACRPNLVDLTACDACVAAGFQVQTALTNIDGNRSHSIDCFYFTILYAAGLVNEFGPESTGSVSCIFRALDRKWRKEGDGFGSAFDLDPEEFGSRPRMRPNTGSIWFKIDELAKATDNFSQKNFIGRGGFGVVYKGNLADGTVVAVKRIIDSDFHGNEEFCNEVEIISNLKHRNLVPLRGCCVTGEDGDYEERESLRYLVYDYMPNGNLDDHLFCSENGIRKQPLTWPQRKSIILDVAKGKALDFSSSGSPRAFLITDWAWSLVKAGKIEEVLDASLGGDGDLASSNPKSIMERYVLVGILCAHVMVALRPTILDAVKMLEGDIEVPAIPDRPMPLGHPSFSRDGNTFSISPALSGPKLQAGDMLR
ncbi:protein kinase superfamily protein [Actinidia rufa]|uniref:Protein kinase superfamily protein n=1 Tax=Actinidia rufa TaxID=165716 RepID=A0A7J0F7W6_9ERIC|nr:protein kinase superfamily protein [Actinidia rufa]